MWEYNHPPLVNCASSFGSKCAKRTNYVRGIKGWGNLHGKKSQIVLPNKFCPLILGPKVHLGWALRGGVIYGTPSTRNFWSQMARHQAYKRGYLPCFFCKYRLGAEGAYFTSVIIVQTKYVHRLLLRLNVALECGHNVARPTRDRQSVSRILVGSCSSFNGAAIFRFAYQDGLETSIFAPTLLKNGWTYCTLIGTKHPKNTWNKAILCGTLKPQQKTLDTLIAQL